MKYRKFGNATGDVSILGLDLARLPRATKIELDATAALVRSTLSSGVNYLDLGSPDSGAYDRDLQTLLSASLSNGHRERTLLVAHLPVTAIHSGDDFNELLARLLASLQLTAIDCLVIDGLNRDSWPTLRNSGALMLAETARNSVRIGRLGFAYRDQYHYLRLLLEDYAGWDFAQFQYSYLDVDRNPGVTGIRRVHELGMGVVVTDPLRGGLLNKTPPAEIAAVWAGSGYDRTLSDWGLRWVWNHPEVTTVVYDLREADDIRGAVQLASKAEANSLGVREQMLINQVRDAYRKLRPVPCTTCRTCMPCPQDINVPRILELYNDAVMFNDFDTIKEIYKREQHSLEACDECGSCVQSCGRMIAILEWLRKADALLGANEQDRANSS